MQKIPTLVCCAAICAAASAASAGEKSYQQAPLDTVFAKGELNPFSQFFTGTTYRQRLSEKDEIFHAPISNITFEPGARTFWHKHSGGQILLVTAGEGRYCERGQKVRVIKKGDVVRIAPEVEHWHGAGPDSWMTHISIETNSQRNQNQWLEAVTDADYAGQ